MSQRVCKDLRFKDTVILLLEIRVMKIPGGNNLFISVIPQRHKRVVSVRVCDMLKIKGMDPLLNMCCTDLRLSLMVTVRYTSVETYSSKLSFCKKTSRSCISLWKV